MTKMAEKSYPLGLHIYPYTIYSPYKGVFLPPAPQPGHALIDLVTSVVCFSFSWQASRSGPYSRWWVGFMPASSHTEEDQSKGQIL